MKLEKLKLLLHMKYDKIQGFYKTSERNAIETAMKCDKRR